MFRAECSRLPLRLHSVVLFRPLKAPSIGGGKGVLSPPPSCWVGGSLGSDSSYHSDFLNIYPYFLMFKEAKYETVRTFFSHQFPLWAAGFFPVQVQGTLPRGGAASPPSSRKVCRLTRGTPSTLIGDQQRDHGLLPLEYEWWALSCSSTYYIFCAVWWAQQRMT